MTAKHEWRQAAVRAGCEAAERECDTLQTDIAAGDAAAEYIIDMIIKPTLEAVDAVPHLKNDAGLQAILHHLRDI